MSDRFASTEAAVVDGAPVLLLRLEGLAMLVLAVVAYGWMHRGWPTAPGWGTFALLFLLPDISMLAYLRSSAAGASSYNLAHTETVPLLLLGVAVWMHSPMGAGVALIWLAHIGFDRVAGYGLKYTSGFGQTHLGAIGRPRDRSAPEGLAR